MNGERLAKYSDSSKTIDQYDFKLDIQMLDLLCKYVVSDNQMLRRNNFLRLREFVNKVDRDTYINDTEKAMRYGFIYKGLEARLDYNLNNIEIIKKHILDSGRYEGIDAGVLSAPEITWLNRFISESISFGYMYNFTDEMLDVCNRFRTADYGSRGDAVEAFRQLNQKIQNQFRKNDFTKDEDITFSLKPGDFENCIYDVYNKVTSPSNKLQCGMQGMNELLGGGFENGRLYVFFGLPGEGKSTMLLNLAFQIKKYNRYYKTKDPTKIPCIVLLNMENKIPETVVRLFSMINGTSNLANYTPDEVIDIFRNKGELTLSDDSPINIIIKFRPTNSENTNYLYQLTDDLNDEGYEVICFIQDYIGRIRSIDHSPELRIEYGNVTDEFKVFANLKDIPLITASQLNRDASKHIDEGRQKNKADLVRSLGRSNISESILILNNIDGGYNLAPEVTRDGKKFLGIQRIKKRYEASDRDYMYLPFKEGSNISLEEDYGLIEPNFKLTLTDGDAFNKTPYGVSQYHTNKIVDLGQIIKADNEPNIFSGSVYSSSSATVPHASAVIPNAVPETLVEPANVTKPVQVLQQPMLFRPKLILPEEEAL